MKVKKMKNKKIVNLNNNDTYKIDNIRDFVNFTQRELLNVYMNFDEFDASQIVETLQTMFDDFKTLLTSDNATYYEKIAIFDTSKKDETKTLTRYEIDELKNDAIYSIENYKLFFQVAQIKQQSVKNLKNDFVSCLDYSSMRLLHEDEKTIIVEYYESYSMNSAKYINIIDKQRVEIIKTLEL